MKSMLVILSPLLKTSQALLASFGLWFHLAVAHRVDWWFMGTSSFAGGSSVMAEAGKYPLSPS
jgi:hypothetical protein